MYKSFDKETKCSKENHNKKLKTIEKHHILRKHLSLEP